MPFRLQLDYDGMTKEQVEEDAKNLVENYPELKGKYRIEPSDTPTCFHVIFPLSSLPTFEEAYQIAESSKCERDWLAFCKRYRSFGLITRGMVKVREKSQILGPREKPKNPEHEKITLPTLLDIKPTNSLDVKRTIKLSEAIEPTIDKEGNVIEEWQWKIEYRLSDGRTHILIGCTDPAQARRRAVFLERRGLLFEHRIVEAKKP